MNAAQFAIIVAAGKGTRFGTARPKQFVECAGLPVVMHAINAFFGYNEKISLLLIISPDDLRLWEELCEQYQFSKPLEIIKGGAHRSQSVRNGLNHIDGNGLVAIHDGVRPCITPALISESFLCAARYGSAVPGVPLKDSLRKTEGDYSVALDRAGYKLMQTPQTFDIKLIRDAYANAGDAIHTDDATVFEQAGNTVKLFEGSYSNIKITTEEDLAIAEVILGKVD